MKVINGNSGLFVAMPSRKKADGTYADIAHPLNSDMRKKMEELVIREYKTVIAQNPNAGGRPEDDDPDAHLR